MVCSVDFCLMAFGCLLVDQSRVTDVSKYFQLTLANERVRTSARLVALG